MAATRSPAEPELEHSESPLEADLLRQAADDVDLTLLQWTQSLSPLERLDAAYRAGKALDRFRDSSAAR